MKRWLLPLTLALALLAVRQARAIGTTWYVSRASVGGDGTSEQTAWSELNRIDWSRVQVGDVVLVDGGGSECPRWGDETATCGMVYNTALSFGKDGVTVRGYNGTPILDGNQTNFRFCAENVNMPPPPSKPGGPVLQTAVSFNGRSAATLENFHVRNATTYGINLGGGDGNTVRNVSVHHINNPFDDTNNSVGITHGWTASGVLIERVEIYRTGQDAVRVAGDSVTLRDSYIHDLYCNHPDGVQAFVPTGNSDVPDGEGKIQNLVVERNVFERVGLQAIFLGENASHQSWVDGALIRGNRFVDSRYGLKTKHTNSTNFVVTNNTFWRSSEFAIEWCCASPGARAPMLVADNVFYQTRNPSGTGFYIPSTVFRDNCLWQSGSVSGGASVSGTLNQDPSTGCSGKGSLLTSHLDLDPVATPTPTPSPTPTLEPSPTATNTATPTPNPTSTLAFCSGWRDGTPEVIECP